jgi:hypothetical protein
MVLLRSMLPEGVLVSQVENCCLTPITKQSRVGTPFVGYAVQQTYVETTIFILFRTVFRDVLPFDNYFTRQYIPEDNSELHTRRRENLKSQILYFGSIHSLL